MPKTLRAALLWLLLFSILLGCVACSPSKADRDDPDPGQNASDGDTCTVLFVVDGEVYDAKSVPAGEAVSRPASQPHKEYYFFLDWYTSEDGGTPYDFSSPVQSDRLYLYARFQVDASRLTHEITTEHMSAIVTVTVTQYKPIKFLGMDLGKDKSTSKSGSGSGVVFEITDSYVLVLTNCHVAYNEKGYTYYEVTVTDYKGNTYDAVQYHSVSKPEKAISADYDLAVLYIDEDRDEHSFSALKPAGENAERGDVAISVGAPDGQKNAIDFGEVKGYKTVTLDNTPTEESNVCFDVLNHSAYVLPGSSGGAILNADLELIGIHYAAERGNPYNGYAIPASKVREFLKRYVYN